jgi:hypothetical protein
MPGLGRLRMGRSWDLIGEFVLALRHGWGGRVSGVCAIGARI